MPENYVIEILENFIQIVLLLKSICANTDSHTNLSIEYNTKNKLCFLPIIHRVELNKLILNYEF